MRSRVRVAAFTLAAVAVVGWAAPAAAAPAYPKPSGRCVDQTDVLGDRCAEITAILLRDEKATSDEIAVAVVPTTGDKSIEAWSTGLFNSWGVGKKDKNNGVLLVVAVDDHRVRLETGRGVTKRLTDAEAKTIVDDVVTPRFAEEDYLGGVLDGLDEVRRELGHSVPANALLGTLAEPATTDDEEQFSPAYVVDNPDSGDDGSGAGWGVLIVVVAGIGLFLALVARGASSVGGSRGGSPGWGRSGSTHHHTTWVGGGADTSTSGFSSSSGSSFGGGSSDGGSGASGSW